MHKLLLSTASWTLLLLLASCAAPHPSGDGAARGAAATVSASDRARTERAIFRNLTQGIERYQLTPGDTLQFLYTEDPRAKQPSYVIGVRDKLRIEFFYHQAASRTVVVRPDGRITLPMEGDVVAAGLTPDQLAARVRDLYRDVYRDPVVTVSVEEFTSAITELSDAVKTSQQGRAKQVVIGPDGLAYLPLLPAVKASGLTVEELEREVNRLYGQRFPGLTVSVSLERMAGDRIFVFGEVRSPGMLSLARPMTALQVILSVGGPLTTGALDRVKVLYWTADGESKVRTLDLESVLQGQKAYEDMLVGTNAVVYVPPTSIAKLDRFVDQYIRQLFLYNGTTVNAVYQLNQQTTTVRNVPPQ